jgi:hypothetical protein
MMGWEEYSRHIKFVVGLGYKIRFWQDKWCGDLPLQDRFPTLFACCTQRDAKIASHMVLIWTVIGVCFGRNWQVC